VVQESQEAEVKNTVVRRSLDGYAGKLILAALRIRNSGNKDSAERVKVITDLYLEIRQTVEELRREHG